MGCDIHAFIEEKYSSLDNYKCKAILYLDRDYDLFTLLAGVRYTDPAPIKPVYEPKGIPCDLSWRVNEEYINWKDDAHSSSVLSLEEVEAISANIVFEDRLHKSTDDVITMLIDIMRNLNKPRLVFWFDN